MSIVGIAASKDYLYLAMTTASKTDFTVYDHHRISVNSDDWQSLMATLSTILNSYNSEDTIQQVVVVACASGMYGASPEAFKAEGFAELKCQECGYPLAVITKKSLLKHLGCQSGQKWQAKAKQLFNTQKQVPYFTAGYDAAISGAYGKAQ